MRSIALSILLALSLFWGGPAQACVVDRYGPYDPTRYPASLVIGGTVIDDGMTGGEPFADIQVSDVFVGAYAQTTYRLKWWINDGGGRCSPPGPDLKAGQQVLVYLRDPDGEPMGWAPIYRMGTPLPTVRDTMPDHLLARLSKEDWFKDVPNARLDEPLDVNELQSNNYRVIGADADLGALILMDQDAALLREKRQSVYFSAGGALSYTDPDTWVTAEELARLKQNKFDILVSFDVAGDGRIEDCTSGHVKGSQADDLAVCEIIKERIRLVPPLFVEERSGRLDLDR
jgi:hypothetical protein